MTNLDLFQDLDDIDGIDDIAQDEPTPNPSSQAQNPSGVPAIDCPLSGAYLIEASAGTGKTWTLTGILLRLLIEKNIAADKIVATTFTKAAAAEMQERLHARLVDFDDACHWLKKQLATQDLYRCPPETKRAVIKRHSEQLAVLADPINEHLLIFLLHQHPSRLDMTLRRIALLLATLDKLFIGTLDSLAQKWLNEFGGQMGMTTQRQIQVNTQEIQKTIIHDELRALHAQVYHQSPRLYQKLSPALFADVDTWHKKIDNALHFLTAPIDGLALYGDEIFVDFQNRLQALLANDWSPFVPYYDDDYRKAQGMNMRNALAKNFGQLDVILSALAKDGVAIFEHLPPDWANFLTKLYDVKTLGFNKGFDDKADTWQNLPLDNLVALAVLYDDYTRIGENFAKAMLAFLAQKVRWQLKRELDKNNQTTFALQMNDLTQAFVGQRGKMLTQYIRHLYPVALIDEVQDINGEQTALIKHLYLNDHAKQTLFERGRGFLLLVGDPKQAIYRFRGGDVANYNHLKTLGLDTRYRLLVNRRSNEQVVSALNAWFGHTSDDGFNGSFGDGIAYQTVVAANAHRRLSWQQSLSDVPFLPKSAVAFLHFECGVGADERYLGVAWHIQSLLASNQHLDDGDVKREIRPSDIAVLARTHADLMGVKKALDDYGIANVIGRMGSVFQTRACLDIYALLLALLDDKDDKLGAVLTGLFRCRLEQSQALLADDKVRSGLLIYLKSLQNLWQKHGVAVALERAFLKTPSVLSDVMAGTDNLWQYLAMFDDGERYLTDCWQLFELLASLNDMPPPSLLDWLLTKIHHDDKDEEHTRLALPNQTAVQLLTIHAAKGLEFAIVYVLGMANKINHDKTSLYPYVKDGERRLSADEHLPNQKDHFKDKNQAENLDEIKRLGYVALTRASEQLFIVSHDKNRAESSLLTNWGFYDKQKTLKIPDALSEYISQINLSAVPSSPSQVLALSAPKSVPMDFVAWADVYPKVQFDGTYRTSFTSLSWQFDWASGLNHAQGANLPDTYDPHRLGKAGRDGTDDDDGDLAFYAQNPSDDIRFGFVRGIVAGTFLHLVLEEMAKLDVMSPLAYAQNVGLLVEKCAKKMALPDFENLLHADNVVHQAMVAWLCEIAYQPFLASQAVLAQLPLMDKKSELSFLLGAKVDVDIKQLGQIFCQYADRPLYDFDDNALPYFAYLSGEIDLVYRYQGKYYVVDYKSNFLGDDWADYDDDKMMAMMNKQGYWLQAAIYQLALHRLLKLKVADYVGHEHHYLGAVEYVFLRGIGAGRTTGRLCWHTPLALILAMDKLL